METVEEEAKEGYLNGSELWLFTDDVTAEGCFFRGGSSSKLLHELVLRLRKTEMEYEFTLLNLCLTLKLMIRLITNYETVYSSNG